MLALAVALTVAEWLRGHLLTGFPWNTFGYALTEPLALAQAVSLVGIWGLTFLAVAIFASPAVLADDRSRYAASLARAGRSASDGPRRDWPATARRGCDASDDFRRRRQAAHHAAQSAAGREIQLRRQGTR